MRSQRLSADACLSEAGAAMSTRLAQLPGAFTGFFKQLLQCARLRRSGASKRHRDNATRLSLVIALQMSMLWTQRPECCCGKQRSTTSHWRESRDHPRFITGGCMSESLPAKKMPVQQRIISAADFAEVSFR